MRLLLVLAVCLAVASALSDSALPSNQQTQSKKLAKGFVTRLPRSQSAGPSGLAFAPDGLYVVDEGNSCVYKFDSKTGGVASQALTCFREGSGYSGIASDSAGNLFIAQKNPGAVLQLGRDGKVARTIASNIPGASKLAIDGIKGDLFVAGNEPAVFRFKSLNSATPEREAYAKLSEAPRSLAFGPDGTLFAATKNTLYSVPFSESTPSTAKVLRTGLKDVKSIAVAPNFRFLTVSHESGQMSRMNLNQLDTITVLVGGTPGDNVVYGPDGCVYATQVDEIVRIGNPDGTCTDVDLEIKAPPKGTEEFAPAAKTPKLAKVEDKAKRIEKKMARTARRLQKLQKSSDPAAQKEVARLERKLKKYQAKSEKVT